MPSKPGFPQKRPHNDLRWLLGLVGAVTHPGGVESEGQQDQEEGEE